ncbi:tyrosine--tRNA ligase [Candidatus Parcubacteria bacterium]|nr:MAG: tyrosine--tRNA ligase [Candidatus Parcubacteria bacterium]
MADKRERIDHLLTRGVEEVIEKKHLETALLGGKKLRVKLGIDPTGDKIHIGRAVVIWKLREFQDLGHTVVLIIGDFTAQIGDPSDKLQKRPFLTKDEVKKNLQDYLSQIGKILDLKKIEVRYNSEWLAKLNFREVSELAELFTFQQILERRNFRERWEKHQEISYREGMYALMQGYDSVAVKADVELGGSDQLFNLLAGRKIQEHYDQKPQDILTTRMLTGLDGRKMSTSWGNVVNIADSPDEQFGKIMSMHDDQIPNYFELATDVSRETIAGYEKDLQGGRVNPKTIKEKLAVEIVKRYHGEKAGEEAGKKWESMFSKKEVRAAELPEFKVKRKTLSVLDLVLSPQTATRPSLKSKLEWQRLITQGAVSINGEVKKDAREIVGAKDGDVLKIGKKDFFRIKIM